MLSKRALLTVLLVLLRYLSAAIESLPISGRERAGPDPSLQGRGVIPANLARDCNVREGHGVVLGLATCHGLAHADDSPYQGQIEEFPALHRRIAFFEERLTSRIELVRYRLMGEVGQLLPLDEAERLLREMARIDPFPMTRQQALVRLVTGGYRIDRSGLPRYLSWPGQPLLDRRDEGQMRRVLRELRGEDVQARGDALIPPSIKSRGAQAGSPAQLLGLLGDESDIARLRPLLDSRNIYVRYSAAVALVNLGETRAGIEGLNRVARAKPETSNHAYVMEALQALHRLGDETAIDRYLDYLAALEGDDEHHARLHYTLGLEGLSRLFGTWQDDVGSWRTWWERRRRGG